MSDYECFQCGRSWKLADHDGAECMKSLGASWQILDMALVDLMDSRITVDRAMKDWHIAIADVKREMRKAYQT